MYARRCLLALNLNLFVCGIKWPTIYYSHMRVYVFCSITAAHAANVECGCSAATNANAESRGYV